MCKFIPGVTVLLGGSMSPELDGEEKRTWVAAHRYLRYTLGSDVSETTRASRIRDVNSYLRGRDEVTTFNIAYNEDNTFTFSVTWKRANLGTTTEVISHE